MTLNPLASDDAAQPDEHHDHGEREVNRGAEAVLVDDFRVAYRVIAGCFVYPEDVDQGEVARAARDALAAVERIAPSARDRLETFLEHYREIAPEDYVDTLELESSTPLYVGHHAFEQPSTCRDIADADRNQYMVELNGIYEHFGFALDDELPDYLPAMAEFLALTIDEHDDALRGDFVEKLDEAMKPMCEEFGETETPYRHLVAALHTVVGRDARLHGGDD